MAGAHQPPLECQGEGCFRAPPPVPAPATLRTYVLGGATARSFPTCDRCDEEYRRWEAEYKAHVTAPPYPREYDEDEQTYWERISDWEREVRDHGWG